MWGRSVLLQHPVKQTVVRSWPNTVTRQRNTPPTCGLHSRPGCKEMQMSLFRKIQASCNEEGEKKDIAADQRVL